MVWVFVAGACQEAGKPWAKAGYGVWFRRSSGRNCSGSFPGRQTVPEAEVQAAIQAVRVAIREGFACLRIHTDSRHLYNGATYWMSQWASNNWQTPGGGAVVGKDRWIELQDVMTQYPAEISWTFVRAHCTNGTEEANRLAGVAARRSGNHDEVLEMLELQAKANKILVKYLQDGDFRSQYNTNEMVDIVVEINDRLKTKLLNDCQSFYKPF